MHKEQSKKNTIGNDRGFTLVELLIAVGLFLVIMVIALGAILAVLDAGREARSLKAVMTNLNFAVEAMSREIKFGTEYYCGVTTSTTWTPQNCTGGGNAAQPAITFITSTGIDTIYRLNGTQLEKSINNGSTYIGVTSPEIIIQDLKFYVFGASVADTNQPRVLMIVRGYAGSKPTVQSRFVIQTSVSQRVLDR